MTSAKMMRKTAGVSIVEFAAVMVLGLPLLIAILFITVEASYLFAIRTNIDIAARTAARQFSIEYGKDPAIVSKGRGAWDAAVYKNISIPKFVADPSQFSDPTFDTTRSPGTVTVTVKYPSAGNNTVGLPPFPNPDPLNLGRNFDITSTATFALE